MRILTKMQWTQSQWLSLPEDERLEHMAWDIYRQQEIAQTFEKIAADLNRKREDDDRVKLHGISPEVYALLRLAELG